MRYGMNGFAEQPCRGPIGCGTGRGGHNRWGRGEGGLRTGHGQGLGLGCGCGALSVNDTEAERRNLELRAEWLKRDLESVQKCMNELTAPEAHRA
jgi:hypothetical protein